MRRVTMGNVRLTSLDRDVWSKPDLNDMVCLDEPQTWAMHNMTHLYHKIFGKHLHVNEPCHRTVLLNLMLSYTSEV